MRKAYAKEFRNARSLQQKVSFAKKVLLAGENDSDDPATQYAILQYAIDMAVRAKDFETAFSSTDRRAATFDMNRIQARVTTLAKLHKGARSKDEHASIAEIGAVILADSVVHNKLESLSDLADLALKAAKKSKDAELTARIEAAAERASESKKEAAAVAPKPRTWTSARGNFKLENAVFVELVTNANGAAVVVISNSEGKRIRVSLDKLSEEDQAYVDTLDRPGRTTDAENPAGPSKKQ